MPVGAPDCCGSGRRRGCSCGGESMSFCWKARMICSRRLCRCCRSCAKLATAMLRSCQSSLICDSSSRPRMSIDAKCSTESATLRSMSLSMSSGLVLGCGAGA
eukprot:11208404-Alexandrium_andersonii.AAC.1